MRNVYQILSGKSEGKRLFGKLKCRWKNYAKVDLRVIGCRDMDWIHVAQDGV
jgi:hypothetical protein